MSVHLTAANVDDRKPIEFMTRDIFGKMFGDKGYISQALFEKLFQRTESIYFCKKDGRQ